MPAQATPAGSIPLYRLRQEALDAEKHRDCQRRCDCGFVPLGNTGAGFYLPYTGAQWQRLSVVRGGRLLCGPWRRSQTGSRQTGRQAFSPLPLPLGSVLGIAVRFLGRSRCRKQSFFCPEGGKAFIELPNCAIINYNGLPAPRPTCRLAHWGGNAGGKRLAGAAGC